MTSNKNKNMYVYLRRCMLSNISQSCHSEKKGAVWYRLSIIIFSFYFIILLKVHVRCVELKFILMDFASPSESKNEQQNFFMVDFFEDVIYHLYLFLIFYSRIYIKWHSQKGLDFRFLLKF